MANTKPHHSDYFDSFYRSLVIEYDVMNIIYSKKGEKIVGSPTPQKITRRKSWERVKEERNRLA